MADKIALDNVVEMPEVGTANVHPRPDVGDQFPREVFIIQITKFDAGFGSHSVINQTYNYYFLTKREAEERILTLQEATSFAEYRYSVQTLWPSTNGPKLVVSNTSGGKPN